MADPAKGFRNSRLRPHPTVGGPQPVIRAGGWW